MGGAFEIDEPAGRKNLLSAEPTNDWLKRFSNRAHTHVSLVESGEESFTMMRDNVDEGFSEE